MVECLISTLDGWVRTGMERDGRMRHTGQTYCTSWKEQGLLASERSWCLTLACGRCVRVGTSPFPHVRTLLYLQHQPRLQSATCLRQGPGARTYPHCIGGAGCSVTTHGPSRERSDRHPLAFTLATQLRFLDTGYCQRRQTCTGSLVHSSDA